MKATDTPSTFSEKIGYPEFLEWLDEDTRAEWVDGEIILMSPASRIHQRIVSFLSAVFKLYVEKRQLGEVIPAPFQMRSAPGLSGREPDILFVRSNRMEIIKETFVDGPPDLVVEVVSKESRTRDKVDKFKEYETGGIQEYWIIDPESQSSSFYTLVEGKYEELHPVNGCYQCPVIPGFWIRPSWLWMNPQPSLQDILEAWATSE